MQNRTWTSLSVALGPLLLAAACSSAGGDAPSSSAATPADAGPDAADASSSEFSTPDETAGTRLKPTYLQLSGNDGSVKLEFAAWYDAERDEPCRVQKMSDGNMHCAPLGESPVVELGSLFQDDACTAPVIAFHGPASTAACGAVASLTTKRYVNVSSLETCALTRLAAFPTTSIPTKTVFTKSGGGSCVAVSLVGKGLEVFAASTPLPEIDPAKFAAITVSNDAPTTDKRLRASRMIHSGADGSKAVSAVRILDGQRNEFCENQLDIDGVHRCIPRGASISSSLYFSDATCSQDVFELDKPDALDIEAACLVDARNTFSRYMTRVSGISCQARTEIFPIVATPPLSTVYGGSPASCAVQSPALIGSKPRYRWQDLPSAIGPGTFSAIADVEHDSPAGYYGKSGARLTLRQSGQGSADGFEAMQSMVYRDKGLGNACVPSVLDDGKTYCVPQSRRLVFAVGKIFADATCTVSVVPVPNGYPECPGLFSDVKLLSTSAGECGGVHLYEPGRLVAATTLYWNVDGPCTAISTDAKQFDVYLGSEVTTPAYSDFVELTPTLVK